VSPARILIITNGHLCRNPRPLKEAETLGRAGYDVTVLAVRDQAPSEEQDRILLQDAPFRHQAVNMLPGFNTGRGTVFRKRLLSWIARQAGMKLGLPSIRSLGPAGPLLRAARRLPADLTIVHNEVPHWVGVQLLKGGRRVAADIEDWHSEDLLPEARLRRPLILIRTVEQTLLNRAVYTTTTSSALADALHARYGGRRPEVIANSFPLQPDPHQGDAGQPPAFFWFSQTLGPGRGLGLFFAAWAGTRHPSRLVLLGEPAGNYDRQLLAGLSRDWRDRVSFRSLVPPAKLPSLIAQHDVGLALEQPFIVNRNLTITNKILQYLNAGLAVVASDTAGHREVLSRSPEAGVIVELHETTRLTQTLDDLIEDRTRLARRQKAARKLAEDTYCWEREEPRLLALVAQALSSRVPQTSIDPG
jgi:glycosyltransferase involved in cell wall biosynthesis